MAKIAIIGNDQNSWAGCLFKALRQRQGTDEFCFAGARELCKRANATSLYAGCVYVPPFADRSGLTPDLLQAEEMFRCVAPSSNTRLVLLSSALIYGTSPGRPSFVTEEYSPLRNGGGRICDQWSLLESLAHRYLNGKVRLTILRPVSVIPSPVLFSRFLSSRFVPTLPGHEPSMQFLSLSDLAEAIALALEGDETGVFNVAPDDVVPLHAAIRIAGGDRLPVPRTLQRLAIGAEALDYWRYPWTVSGEKARAKLGFVPRRSSAATLCTPQPTEIRFDDFGMDKDYIRFYGKTLFRILRDYYWRIEERGLEHVPREGRAVLVGMHRGFMPWDGVMVLHLLVHKTGRYPRFLTHPALLKFPFLANFMTKLGGVVACQQNADRVLASDGLLAIFPEGIHGAFVSYRQAYRLRGFGRDAFVKFALRNRAPLVPFVTLGSAEIFPILAKIKSKLWTRYTDWPCFPLTPTFPLVPLPLPSKWHTQFLAPIHVEKDHPPEAASDRSVVKAISLEVRTRMQQAINEMLGRRRSIFFGSIFEPETG